MRKNAAAACLSLAAVGLAICVGIFWYKQHAHAIDAEVSAVRVLEGLGAIIVRDSSQQHVASLNLSMLKSRAELEAALTVVDGLQWLASLDVSRTPLCDNDLDVICQLTGLTSLALAGSQVTDAGVAKLVGLDCLASLNLAQTQLTSRALDELAQLPGLRILDLTGTRVSSKLGTLSGLPLLEWVALRNVNLTDDALPGLAECSTLHRISLEGATYSEASFQALRDRLPAVTIDR